MSKRKPEPSLFDLPDNDDSGVPPPLAKGGFSPIGSDGTSSVSLHEAAQCVQKKVPVLLHFYRTSELILINC